MDETMLRVANVKDEDDLEAVRDALDDLGADYEHVNSEHVNSEPEDFYPQTAYFQIRSDLSGDADAVMARLSEKRGFDAEIL
ncbi:MAG TPA: hypothetical protein VK357_14515 [Rubrobacteraceae bacterium]|nr:hypothetical protein [Rubrobacteraceae bacterium]